jgi:hypothetical protein
MSTTSPPSRREALLQALGSTLTSVAAQHGARYLRSPTEPLEAMAKAALILLPEQNSVTQRSNQAVTQTLTVRILACTRQAGSAGEAPWIAADAMLADAHLALRAAAGWGGLALAVDEVDCDWDIAASGSVSAVLPARYALHYRTHWADTRQAG